MKQHSSMIALAALLAAALAPPVGATGDPTVPDVLPAQVLIDVWVPHEGALESLRITLSLDTEGASGAGNEITIIDTHSSDPWWSDKIIISRAHRGVEIVRSMTRVVWKIAIRVVPVPAIY